ncbi:MAG: DMT family transporter [Chloroflexi bacterium]|nr:DMT family transporter [Chloroflexota bacterium]
MRAPAALALAGAIVAISCAAILIRWSETPPLALAGWRLAVAALVQAPLAVTLEGAALPAGLGAYRGSLLCAGLLLGAHFGLWTVSLGLTSVASSVVFVSAHPLLVAVGERWWLGASLGRSLLVAVACSLAGALLLGWHDLRLGGEALAGDVLAFGGAVALAGYLLLVRRVRARAGALALSTALYAVAAGALLLAAVSAGERVAPAAGREWLVIAALALVSTLGGHTVFTWALRYLPATAVAIAFVGEPAVASLLAWALLGEALAAPTVLGGALTLAGVYVAARAGAAGSQPRSV